MASIPLVALSANTQQPSPLDQYGKMLSLRNLMNQGQTQQLQQTGLAQENQIRALQIKDQETLRSLSPQHVQKDDKGTVTGFDTEGFLNDALGKQVNPQTINQMRMQYANGVKDMAGASEAVRNNEIAKNKAAYELLEGVRSEPDIAKRSGILQAGLPNLQKMGFDTSKLAQQPQLDDKSLTSVEATLGVNQQMLADAKTKAETEKETQQANLAKMEAAEKGSPLTKMENDPTMFAGEKLPASTAYLEGKITDSDPTIAARATRLLNTAKVAKQTQLAMEASKKATDQAITQGSPAISAKLLVDGDATLSQMKARGVTPEFIQQTLVEAKRLDANWNAQKAEADFDVAKSPAQVAFFGSAKSLTDKGGTLDQLMAAAKDIPRGKIPIFNSVADAMAAATGSGPIAKYASIALGVADDYSKVMGGGQGSDTSRTQALNLIAKNLSPEGRVGSVEGIRGSVESQKNSRIGGNPILKRMYGGGGETQAAEAQRTAGGKTYTQADVDAAVAAHPGMTAAQIESAFKAKNWAKKQ